ncbi:MAG: UDP-glucose 4-epimerase GalE [Crocinitomicaceae bacterium]|nr:MAG: UDP-glucose 4-epimerase GalE [Crocinitomicaceae bacterium]
MEKNRYVLVTGGAGYIGSHTVVELMAFGFTPVVIDDFRNAESLVIDNMNRITGSEIQVIQAACQDEETLEALFKAYSFEGVIHFAADKAVGESVQNPLKYYDNNINSLLSILKMMEKYRTKSLVFSSSCSVYGNPVRGSEAIVETIERLAPESPYGNTKLICEQIIRHWIASNPRSNAVLLRYFNPIGAHRSGLIGELPQGIPNNLLPYITQTAVGIRKSLTVFGNDYQTADGTCIRDYIHVSDLAKAHVNALQWSEQQDVGTIEPFNVGTGKGTSVLEMISTFEKVTGISLQWHYGPRRAGDVQEIFANPSKIEHAFGWKAQFTVADAIRDAWNWEQNRIQHD